MINEYLSGSADKIELIYTYCHNVLKQEPRLRTILPLEPTGLEDDLDEIFEFTSKDGQFEITKEEVEN